MKDYTNEKVPNRTGTEPREVVWENPTIDEDRLEEWRIERARQTAELKEQRRIWRYQERLRRD